MNVSLWSSKVNSALLFFLLSTSLLTCPVIADDSALLIRQKGCLGCHSLGGKGGQVGPTLDNVGSRYSRHWLAQWLINPAAVKPGTKMPNLNLRSEEVEQLVNFLSQQVSILAKEVTDKNVGTERPAELDPSWPGNEFLDLGVNSSYIDTQRYSLQDQIQSFIPPIYEPILTQPAFVLPPGAIRISASYRDTGHIDASDVTGQRDIGARFVEFDLQRQFFDVDFFLGLDNNFTLRINIPVLTSSVNQQINPGFRDPISAFPQGDYQELGDIGVFLKKKFIDQGNFPVALAGVVAVTLPTGSDDETFDPRTLVSTPMGDGIMALPAIDQSTGMPIMGSGDGTFRRFTDSGELPSPLQPGLGTTGISAGVFMTRIFTNSTVLGRGAIHAGGLYEYRPEHDGVDPGDRYTLFASLVKPLYRDQVSLDLSYIYKDQDKDSYQGLMAVPTGQMPPAPPIMIVDRPAFSGGSTQFAAVSLVFAPNPLFKMTLSYIKRIGEPDLGPSPDHVFRIGFQHTFASNLFQ